MSFSDFARSGLRKSSPARGARSPPMRNVAFEPGFSARNFSERAQCPAVISMTGKPCSAYQIAGCSEVESGSFPKRFCSALHPATAPGTVTVWTPR